MGLGLRRGWAVPRLFYTIDFGAVPPELAAQAIAVLRLQEFARRTGLRVEESRRPDRREFALVIPPDRLNDVLWDLDLEGLSPPQAPHIENESAFALLEEFRRDSDR